MCGEVEKTASIENNFRLHQLFENTGPRNPTMIEVMKQSDSKSLHSQTPRLERWAGHFREQFSSHTKGLPHVPGSETMRAVTGPLSGMEVIRVVGLLKWDKAAGPN